MQGQLDPAVFAAFLEQQATFQEADRRAPGQPPEPRHLEKHVPQTYTSPPAHLKIREKLPQVVVTKEDLLEESNHECIICLEAQRLGGIVTKLPCGHIFCSHCIVDWLSRNCTCPVCRYGLPTGNVEFDTKLRNSNLKRRVRYKISDLMALPASKLKNLLALHQIRTPTGSGIEKRELVDALVASEEVEVIPEHESSVYSIHELEDASREELVNLFRSLRMATPDDVSTKEELLSMLIESGKLKVDYGSKEVEGSSPIVIDFETAVPSVLPAASNQKMDVEELQKASVKILKEMLTKAGVVPPAGLTDKSELVKLVYENQ